ncbi:MAG: U32 family peptidase [Bacteroides sp.]|nr:U32 family peptidase [Bacteroides sp.]MCM1413897.1 U32 family peptidase [Bacteroides sp.]
MNSKTPQIRPIELLAPARSSSIAREAILHGADAVYMGASSHGARAAAANTVDDIRRTVDFAHQFGAKVYVTVNTIIYEQELTDVERLIRQLYTAGVDALIVQDMAVLRLDIPPIALHASTQCDIRTPEKAQFLARTGFSQLVLPREFTLEETAAVHQLLGPDVALEAFVHGALCVSYSGDCQAGFASMKRSANRGECPQICRHKFNLEDSQGNVIIRDKHLLSLRDLNRSAIIDSMLRAGISSFKIEGRLKDVDYVKNVVGAYRSILDRAIESDPDLYRRSSYGTSSLTFKPDLDNSFNRGYTDYFSLTQKPKVRMASIDTPKWIGRRVGKVKSVKSNIIKADLTTDISNGDGLGYFDSNREFHGFRVNRTEGNTLHLAQSIEIAPGTILYRNHDRKLQATLAGETATRTVAVELTLRRAGRGIALEAVDEALHRVETTIDLSYTTAKSPQTAVRREVLSKTGATIYRVAKVDDRCGDMFIARSELAELRRRTLDALAATARATYRFDKRLTEDPDARLPEQYIVTTHHDNIANSKAADFYRSHGATSIAPAMESSDRPIAEGTRVMTTRYCLRRELGCCLRTPEGSKMPAELYLQSGPMRFKLHFDCANCRMHMLTAK